MGRQRYDRERSLFFWIQRRLKRGESVEQIESAMIHALNAPPSAEFPQIGQQFPRIYDGSGWQDNPYVEVLRPDYVFKLSEGDCA